MRSLSAPVLAALASGNIALAQLVQMQFSPEIALNTSNMDLTWLGVTYKGAYGLGEISPIQDAPGEVRGITLTLAGVDPAYVSLALDDVAVVQQTPIVIRTAILDSTYQVIDAPVEWTGKFDTMTISEDGDTCTISATAEHSAVDLLKGSALTYSDADQQALYPGDRFFMHVVPQAAKPVVWPNRIWYMAFGRR